MESPSRKVYVVKTQLKKEWLESIGLSEVPEQELHYDPDAPDEKIVCWEFTGEQFSSMCTALRLRAERAALDTADFAALSNSDGLPTSEDVDPRTLFAVRFSSSDNGALSRQKLTEILREHLAKPLGLNVKLEASSRSTAAPTAGDAEEPGVFLLAVGRSPEIGIYRMPHTAWGASYNGETTHGVGRWMDGIPLLCPEGEEIGAVSFDSRRAFIYAPLLHDGTPDKVERILTAVCGEIVRRRTDGVPSMDEVRRYYVTSCAQRLDIQRRALEGTLASATSELSRLQSKLVEAIRAHRDALSGLAAINANFDALKGQLEAEFNALVAMPAVTGVSWRGDKLCVDLSEMRCIDPRSGNEHSVGEFRVMLDSRSAEVYFYNKTRRIKGMSEHMHAPHVFADGRACLGNMHEVIPRLVAQYEWSAAVQMCIHFLSDVNVDDTAGKHVNNWPISRTKLQIENEERAKKGLPSLDEGEATPQAEFEDEDEDDYDNHGHDEEEEEEED